MNATNGHKRSATRRVKVLLHGVVQGVGFRPFVYRLANELHVRGWVNNSPAGVEIEAESDPRTLETFLARLQTERPLHSVIQNSETIFLDSIGYVGFSIHESNGTEEKSTLILPDIALCDECLREMFDPANRRYRYPFINCTRCGPRFSIMEALPYDRPNTTMKKFAMCPECEAEYHDPADRRFHAQPIACPHCGPRVELWGSDGKVFSTHNDAVLQTAQALREGKIVAFKGLGGFQLLVDAANEEAVQRLRLRKHREEKPFATMFPSLEMATHFCEVSETEKRLLVSPESPIVLLKKKNRCHCEESRRGDEAISLVNRGLLRDDGIVPRNDFIIATSVAPHNPYLGVMLPYTPLHHLLMSEVSFPIVATSGNISDEPMCIDKDEALKKLGGIADLFLVHNRPIHRYVDDSIARIVADREMILRRARGYAPLPIRIPFEANEPLLAVGGHLKNTVALQKGKNIFLSQHIGDLETVPAMECFKNTIDDFLTLYEAKPSVVIHDAHPNYVSTSYARHLQFTKQSSQHHFAHIASCMADNGLTGPVLGISWDGTGYGLDGTIWGGECVEFTGGAFERVATMKPFRLPGGDAAVKESVRSAIGMLYEMMGKEVFHYRMLCTKFSDQEKRLILQMMEKKINSPLTSSVGRMFDAVGALLGLGDRATYEGQTAMEVEFAAHASNDPLCYPFYLVHPGTSPLVINWEPMIQRILGDLQEKCRIADIARRFHNTLVEMIVATARCFDRKNIVLSGGCFQNALLLEQSVNRLQEEGFAPYWHRHIPTNDGGISAGQIYMHHLTVTNKDVREDELSDVSSFMSQV